MLREEAKRTVLVLARLRHEVLLALGKNHIDFLRGLALTSNADDRQYASQKSLFVLTTSLITPLSP